jgi:hypothetical protein
VIEPLSGVDRERRALLDHAARCRRVAAETTSHAGAASRLRTMAEEYEARAQRLEGEGTFEVARLTEDDGEEMFKSEQTIDPVTECGRPSAGKRR